MGRRDLDADPAASPILARRQPNAAHGGARNAADSRSATFRLCQLRYEADDFFANASVHDREIVAAPAPAATGSRAARPITAARIPASGQADPERQAKIVVRPQRVGLAGRRIERDIAEVEQPARPTTTFIPIPAYIGRTHENAEVENVSRS